MSCVFLQRPISQKGNLLEGPPFGGQQSHEPRDVDDWRQRHDQVAPRAATCVAPAPFALPRWENDPSHEKSEHLDAAANGAKQRRLAAILAADVAGYSRLVGTDELGTLTRLQAHWDALIEPTIRSHNVRIVRIAGDGILAEFASVVDAVQCAVKLQRAMAERNVGIAAEERIEFRMGINVGDILIDRGDMWGDGVNVAARLEGAGDARRNLRLRPRARGRAGQARSRLRGHG